MRISSIAFANVRRRKAKASFLAFGIAIGIGTVVALLSLTGALKEEIGSQLDRFGANIVIIPKSNTLALDYGGISVSVGWKRRTVPRARIEPKQRAGVGLGVESAATRRGGAA